MDERGEPVTDDTLLILLNAHHEPVPFTLPAQTPGDRWEVLVDTNAPELEPGARAVAGGAPLELAPRSLMLLRRGRVRE